MYSILDVLDAVRFRWKVVAIVFGAAILAALAYLLVVTPKYEARASLIVDVDQPDPVDEQAQRSEIKTVMATQAELVTSPGVASQAAVKAGFDKDDEVKGAWKRSGGDKPYAEWLTVWILDQVNVNIGKDTNIVAINASARSPEDAARIANGFADAAVDSRYELRTEPAKAYAAWLEKQVDLARVEVEAREKTLSELVSRTGLAQGNDLSSEGTQLADIAGQLAIAEARAASARQSAFADEQGVGDAENSEAIQRLRTEIAQATALLSQLKAVYGPTHPEVMKTTAQVRTLNERLETELATVRGAYSGARQASANAERAAAIASEARLRTLEAEQRRRLQSQGENVARYNTLQNEFVAAQQNFNALSERLSKMRLQSEVPQTEVQVLDRASPFLTSRVPSIPLTVALAGLLGGLIGVCLAILLEYLNPRVRSWRGVERLLGARVIGRVALPAPGPLSIGKGDGPRLLGGPA
ncbi:GumC family protein [Altererythrobacter sp. Z27]|uniref:GumC family protein n=1 Tax=Altererythrobacter sp. Z27 TaxID=3461147 RepID=UPI004043B657